MREILTINYVEKEFTRKNKAIINLQPKNTYKRNQKLNSNWREGSHSILRDIRMAGIGHLRKNNTQLIKH